MPQAFFEVSLDGWEEVQQNLARLSDDLGAPRVPAMQCALFMEGQVTKAFDEGGLVEPWEPLSMFSRFVRKHRKGAADSDPKVMNDTGRLKNSMQAFIDEGGAVAGVGTNVEYAKAMQDGGPGQGGDVDIAAFSRKTPSGKASRVRGFTMHIQAGHYVPARPFLPRDANDIDRLGWVDKFAEIFSSWISGDRA